MCKKGIGCASLASRRYPQPIGWVDTHCHLQLDGRPPSELLGRAPDVDWVVVPGIDLESSRAAQVLAEGDPQRVVATAGLHPHDAERWPAERDEISLLVGQVAAVGETGLDFYRNLAPKADQIASFSDHIELATAHRKPLVVHCRDAFAEVYRLVESGEVGPLTILHCWTGGTRWTKRFLDLGVTFSFAGPVAFETGESIRLGAALVPPERAVVETDTPYLAPPPHRHERNEPAFVSLVGRALGEAWGMPVADVAEQTSANARRLFRA
jgi:TatD DNase family protein